MLELLLGQIPEAIYFALFMIFTKELKTRRTTFTILMVVEYLLVKYSNIFSVEFHIIYTITTFITLKVLYKEKSQVTDIFTFGIASLGLIIISIPTFLISNVFTNNIVIANVIQKIILFVTLISLKCKLPNIQKLYKYFWNRNDMVKKPIKSTTFRAINVFVFNMMFAVINICMLIALHMKEV